MPEYKTMTDLALEKIKTGIMSGQYPASTHLMPGRLEQELDLSRVSIREALYVLRGKGLVTSLPNKGMIVADLPDTEEVRLIFELRFMMEPQMTRAAAPNITEPVLEELEELDRRMLSPETTPLEFFMLNQKFHLLIYQQSGWDRIYNICDQLFSQIQGVRFHYRPQSVDYQQLKYFQEEHILIIKALRAGQAEEAGRLVLKNIRKGLDDTLQAGESLPEKGTKTGS